jgi:hypothetical protein
MALDAFLTKNDCRDYEMKYIDISTPEVLNYLEDVNNIVEGRLPLPYVSVDGRPFCWGIEDAGEAYEELKGKICP